MSPHRRRRVLAALLTLGLALGLGAWSSLRPETWDVVSIATLPTYQDPELLARAWALPVAATYGPDALQFQAKASTCGPTSLANVWVSFGDDPSATAQSVVEGTAYCWTGQCIPGLILDELAEIAEYSGTREITVLRDLSIEEFREHMRASNRPDRRYVVNFLRGPLFGEGGGHHSPIGGYLEREDLVFVLDVNERFGPWLVETERLFAAVDTVDGSSDRERGLLLVK